MMAGSFRMAESFRLATAAGLLTSVLVGPVALAQRAKPSAPAPPDNATCLACHEDSSLVSASGKRLTVDPAKYGGSVHGSLNLACIDCHVDLKSTVEFPHADKVAKVTCTGCHESSVAKYNLSIHAQARRQSADSPAATCVDCHTTHEIRPAKDAASSTYPLNLPATCSRCHGDASTIARGHIKIGDVASLYKDSIHGRAVTKSGLLVAANCTSCHGNHDIRKKTDPESRVFKGNIPGTCGACHEGIKTQYDASVHGEALGKANPRAPVCADCHSAHQIQRADVSSWQLDVIRECGTCHVDNIKTYRDTFHGQVTSLGFVRVATCAACHSAHNIHRSTDERSMTSPARVLSTCQQCHPNATAGFAKYDPHADKHDPKRNPFLYYASTFMTWLLFGTFAFFGLHAVLWLPRGFKHRNGYSNSTEAPSEPPAAATDDTDGSR